MNLLEMSDVVDDRNNIINSYGDIFDSMLSPVGFTFNLKRSKRIRLEDNSRRTITLEDKHLNNIWNIFTDNLLHAIYPRSQRKCITRPALAIGGFEYGKSKNNPHLHIVVDNVNKIYRHSFEWIIEQCISNTRKNTSWIGKEIHFNSSTDRKFVSYFLKSSRFVSLYR
tara:strand:- start:3357 stop:3860 length:504 start_codon:yes stop_codon:yes gene_type:complete